MVNPQLPEDVIIEILIRLPVKSIVKLRCVSRTWRDLIRSPIFIHRYQNRERKQSVLLVKRYTTRQYEDEGILSFHNPDFPELLVSPNLSFPVLNDLDFPTRICSNFRSYSHVPIYGPCNGLVCIPVDNIIFLCNPALREFKPLPPPSITCPMGYRILAFEFGFGFDPNTGAYKVMQISQIREDYYEGLRLYLEHNYKDCLNLDDYESFDLYDSASNSWKHIDEELPKINFMPSFQTFFGGAMHWYAANDNINVYILCFDIRTEAFQLLDFPDDFPKAEDLASLTVLNENLALIGFPLWREEPEPSQVIEIWVMKQYGVKESWTKQFVIRPYVGFYPFLILNDEWLLVESDNGQLGRCALNENKFKGLPFYGFHLSLSAVVYEESLINLNDIISSDCENG
ncbi:F-box/kelch-repeat protein At3g06240-like isoform X2 [Primulina tabacum]|uniref:F-box/kelch-repeat protein At3g06240-like isoform X1 n=1 Tax=Primulina tabacum TaxID=48773 RepID=UPI003F59350A